jgi:two-component system, NarL family, response regulator NreC
MRAIQVHIADDQPVVLAGLRTAFSESPDIEVLGESRTTLDTVQQVLHSRPDVLLCDVAMEGMSGFGALSEIHRQRPETRCVVFTAHSSPQEVQRSFEAGAAAFITKTEELSNLPSILRCVHAGQTYLSQSLVRAAVTAPIRPPHTENAAQLLTVRERRVLELLVQEKSSKEIAALLDISARTVGAHRANIMRKLDIHSVGGLVRYSLHPPVSTPNAEQRSHDSEA